MDPLWKDIPLHLAEHICNQLPKVRMLPNDLKKQIEDRRLYVHKCIYPDITGLARTYNCLQVPEEGRTYTIDEYGTVKNMMASVIRLPDGRILWTPNESYLMYSHHSVNFEIL